MLLDGALLIEMGPIILEVILDNGWSLVYKTVSGTGTADNRDALD